MEDTWVSRRVVSKRGQKGVSQKVRGTNLFVLIPRKLVKKGDYSRTNCLGHGNGDVHHFVRI